MQPLILANGELRDEIIQAGALALRNGAGAADVAEQIARAVEDDPDEHSVGYSGYPNILGEVELDASFMDGATLKAGAVAGLKGFRHPISVARQVAARLPHVLLVGAGATRFADEIGAERREMLTDYTTGEWHKVLQKLALNTAELSVEKARALIEDQPSLIDLVNQALRPPDEDNHDTMNVMVQDVDGHIVSAVTTSGIAWKYPGRVGDSPIIGAGNYCDDRAGAAACMGLGEITMRLSSCAYAVTLMRMGKPLHEAGSAAVQEMLPIIGRSTAEHHMSRADWLRMLLIDKYGHVGGYATRPGLQFKAQYAHEDAPRVLDCVFVE